MPTENSSDNQTITLDGDHPVLFREDGHLKVHL